MAGLTKPSVAAKTVPVAVGIIDMRKVHHMLYKAAWWRVQAMSSQIVSTDAIEQSWRTVVMYSIALLSQVWRPQVETVEITVSDTKMAHNVKVFTQQMHDQYLEYLHTRGPTAAQM